MTGRILIVDGTATNRILMKVRLAAACYETVLASGLAEAMELAHATAPDLILADQDLPDATGAMLCRAVRADPAIRDLPIVILSASHDTATRLAAFEAGADDVLAKPAGDMVLHARLRSLLRDRDRIAPRPRPGMAASGLAEPAVPFQSPPHIALIADDLAGALSLRNLLRAHLPSQITVATRAEALAGFGGRQRPDVIVIRTTAEGLGGMLGLVSELRVRNATRDAAIVLLAPGQEAHLAALALDMGACDLIESEAAPPEIALRLGKAASRKREEDQWRKAVANELRLAATDALTGLHNRRHALPELARIAERAQESGRPYAVLMLDIDHFKAVNDTLGHGVGDRVLCEIADRLAAAMRAGDLLARIGGEEFMVALPDCPPRLAHTVAERLRQLVADQPVLLARGSGPIRVTMSVGIAVSEHRLRPAEVLDRADQALLACKAAGRNRVSAHRPAA